MNHADLTNWRQLQQQGRQREGCCRQNDLGREGSCESVSGVPSKDHRRTPSDRGRYHNRSRRIGLGLVLWG